MKKIFLLIFAAVFFSACGVESEDGESKYGVVTVSSVSDIEDTSHIAMKFSTDEKVKVESLHFSVFGLKLDTDFSVSGGCQWKVLERSILVTCNEFYVSPDVGQRLDIWISGPWDIIELNSIKFDGASTLVRVDEESGNLRWNRVVEGTD